MVDTFSKKNRSKVMSKIRSKDTQPEMVVRSLLHLLGYRFRLHRRDLPGTPDIVLPKYGIVIFVHGCFWHQHRGCNRATMPKSNKEYWMPKLKRNKAVFKTHEKALQKQGWKVFVIWECESKNEAVLRAIISDIFNKDLQNAV